MQAPYHREWQEAFCSAFAPQINEFHPCVGHPCWAFRCTHVQSWLGRSGGKAQLHTPIQHVHDVMTIYAPNPSSLHSWNSARIKLIFKLGLSDVIQLY